jgi:hypothetical protein
MRCGHRTFRWATIQQMLTNSYLSSSWLSCIPLFVRGRRVNVVPSVLCTRLLAICVSVFLTPAFAQSSSRIERNVVYGMYSGLSLLMDVHYPLKANGRGIIFIAGSAFYAQLGYADTPLKDTRQVHMYAKPLLEAGYTVFAITWPSGSWTFISYTHG